MEQVEGLKIGVHLESWMFLKSSRVVYYCSTLCLKILGVAKGMYVIKVYTFTPSLLLLTLVDKCPGVLISGV